MARIHMLDGEAVEAGGIYCIGRNVFAHALELGNAPPDEPLLFLKSPAALRPLAAGAVAFPDETFHHDVSVESHDSDDGRAMRTLEWALLSSDAARGTSAAAALASLARVGAGASGLYPAALSCLEALRPHRVDDAPMRGAERLAGRLLTLPVNGSLRGRRWAAALEVLSRL